MRQTFLVVLALVVVLGAGGQGVAGGEDPRRATLEGLRGVYILVGDFDEGNRRAGFEEDLFRTDAELKLRLAGIRILTEEERLATPGMPFLQIAVSSMADEPNEVDAYDIRLALVQRVRLDRDPSLAGPAATWEVGSIGRGDVAFVRSAVKDHLDQFLVAWLSVNPKK